MFHVKGGCNTVPEHVRRVPERAVGEVLSRLPVLGTISCPILTWLLGTCTISISRSTWQAGCGPKGPSRDSATWCIPLPPHPPALASTIPRHLPHLTPNPRSLAPPPVRSSAPFPRLRSAHSSFIHPPLPLFPSPEAGRASLAVHQFLQIMGPQGRGRRVSPLVWVVSVW